MLHFIWDKMGLCKVVKKSKLENKSGTLFTIIDTFLKVFISCVVFQS